MKASRRWSEIFKVLREKKVHQPRILYPGKLSFKVEGKTNIFSDKQILRKFVARRTAM